MSCGIIKVVSIAETITTKNMETTSNTITKGTKAIWNYSRNHYANEKAIQRDGMIVEVLDVYNNGHCSILFAINGITSVMLCELTPIN